MAIISTTATFTGAEDSVAVSWTALGTSTPAVSLGVAVDTSQPGNTGVVDADFTSLTSSGCTVVPSARFIGTVEVIAMDQ